MPGSIKCSLNGRHLRITARLKLATFSLLLIVACRSSAPAATPDPTFTDRLGKPVITIDDPHRAAAAIKVAIASMARDKGPQRIVLHESVSRDVRNLFRTAGVVVTPAQVPRSEEYLLPPDYLVIQELTVTGKTARFRAWAGPVWRGFACGVGHDLQLDFIDDAFKVGDVSLTVC